LVNYSKVTRANKTNTTADDISNVLAEFESSNLLDSLNSDSPFIISKIKNLGFNSENYTQILRQISNNGLGESWQNFIRGIFNTRYITNQINNSFFDFIKSTDFVSKVTEPQLSIKNEERFETFINESTTSNKIDFTDLFPFTNLNWSKENMANGKSIGSVETLFDTKGTLFYNPSKKTITNFQDGTDTLSNKPFTHFVFENVEKPEVTENNLKDVLRLRYENPNTQLITEGNINYINYNGNLGLANQTSSMLNSPYFVNAIQEGITKFRNNDPYPFTVPAYLFINSLPLSTLREKYVSYEFSTEKYLGYIFSSLKKFAGVHKVPYAWILKIGSIWHRYKTYLESGNNFDILDNSWKNFNSVGNYDPVTSAATKYYSLTINNANVDIVLEDVNTINIGGTAYTYTTINVGFYPKLINDFNVFYQGYEIIKSTQQVNGIASINGNLLSVISINLDLIQVGSILAGNSFIQNTTIVSQVNGTPGGVGDYIINFPQNVTSGVFYIVNSQTQGYSESLIQSALSSGLTMDYVSEAIIDEIDLVKRESIRIIPWSVSVKTPLGNFSYQIPSSGTLLNQTKFECFQKGIIQGTSVVTIPVTGNTAIHNGAIRNFWTAPNYGYFDNNKIVKPTFDSYLKFVDSTKDSQENFSFGPLNPTKIEELLSVFSKEILDKFEDEFLIFSTSVYDQGSGSTITNLPGGIEETPTQVSFKNFQALMREMMLIPNITGNTGTEVVSKIQTTQLEKINSYLSDFLKFDIIFKYGNPSNYERKLFNSFSFNQITDPITWDKYLLSTSDAIPVNGAPSLVVSRINYPAAWSALESYVGFSSIPELVYKDEGSYITDFFVDLNVAFTEENVKRFAPIIKIYATQKLNQFQSNPIDAPTPPVTNPPQIVGKTTLKDLSVIDIEYYDSKYRTLYRTSGGTLLYESLPELPNIVTRIATDFNSLSGRSVYYSAITNQVIELSYGSLSNNPQDPQYIVFQEFVIPTTYTSLPSANDTRGKNSFQTAMTDYLDDVENFQGKIINNLFPKLQRALPNVDFSAQPIKQSKLTAEPQPKVELWETFKSLNDKWISGNDYKNKTLFEDVLLLDRANRNIGDKVLVDIFGVTDLLVNINAESSLYTYVSSILTTNHFVVLTIPNYVNFYNVQDAVKNPIPRFEGTTDFANTLFGTFLNVDYRESTAKMVCTFAGKPSEQPDVKNVDFRFRSDSFDLTRASDNPLVENQTNKTDWDKSNRVVGFNVDIGPQNQGVFKNFSVGQNSSLSTAESLQILNQMANQGNNRGGATQSVSLYNLYKNRSYTCSVDMLGNALIQPTMYFNLRNVPMFNGSYYITSVDHTITNGSFETTFDGVRQPVANLPKIDNYLQNLRVNLVNKINELIKQSELVTTTQQSNNIENITNSVTSNLSFGVSPDILRTSNESCKPTNTVPTYSTYVQDTNVSPIIFNYKSYFLNITQKTNDSRLLFAIFYWTFVNSNNDKNGLTIVGNNPMLIRISENWGSIGNKKYFCNSKNIPFFEFETIDDFLTFIVSRWEKRVISLPLYELNSIDYIQFCYVNSFSDITVGQQSFDKLPTTSLSLYVEKFEQCKNILLDTFKSFFQNIN